MRLKVCGNYNEMSLEAAKTVASQIIIKPDCVLGLATGSTPLGMYNRLIELGKEKYVDFSEVKTFNLDEYYPIKHSDPRSYRRFMNEKLFNGINIKPENTHVPDGETDDPEKECAAYDRAIKEAGGIDLQILGIGRNGHIGFNEPDVNLICGTHVTALTDDTIDANSRFFDSAQDVPKKALTMGIATILKSRKIILLASGKNKHSVVRELLNNSISTGNPATFIKVHSDITLICDKDAFEG